MDRKSKTQLLGNGCNCLIQDSKVARRERFDPSVCRQRVNGEERFFLLFSVQRDGAPGETRTPDPLVRSQMLYPAELRALGRIISVKGRKKQKCRRRQIPWPSPLARRK